MRTRPLTIATLLVAAAGLTACQAPAAGTIDGCSPMLATGGAASAVTVERPESGAPTVTFDVPLIAEADEVLVTGGEGERVADGDIVDADYVVLLGKSGATLTSSYPDASGMPAAEPLRLSAGGESTISQAVACAAPGATVVLTSTIEQLFGPQAASPELDVTAADTAVVVLEVTATHPGRAEGNARPGQQGMPAVTLATDGTPGLTFPGSPAPADLTVMQSIAGTGDVVGENDAVLVHYTGVIWERETVFDSSWERGEAVVMNLGDGSLIPGFSQAIVGQPLGSQVVVSIPQELGYNDPATRPQSIGEGEHLVFVIDILDRVEPEAG